MTEINYLSSSTCDFKVWIPFLSGDGFRPETMGLILLFWFHENWILYISAVIPYSPAIQAIFFQIMFWLLSIEKLFLIIDPDIDLARSLL